MNYPGPTPAAAQTEVGNRPPGILDHVVSDAIGDLRRSMGERLFLRVAGPEGESRRARIHDTPGERWFGPDSAIQQVHADASMFAGGIRALLLQSLHPLAMAGVSDHSGFAGDPWGRLQRTSHFLAVTTFGTAADADKMVGAIRRVHATVQGTTQDGRSYSATDPHLLRWVHVAEIDSFLAAHQTYGRHPLDQEGRDAYVADTARVAEELGVLEPPRTEEQLRAQVAAYRPELESTPQARQTARFLLVHPPLPLLARAPYSALSASAVAMLPLWARRMLRLPFLPLVESTVVRVAGEGVTRGIRWAMSPPESAGSGEVAS